MAEALELRLREQLDRNGVALISGAPLEGFEPGSERRLTVLAGGRRLAADLALVALGVRPSSDLAAAAGLALGPSGAIAVNERMQTSDPDIYSAGDCADAFHVVTGARTWIPLALRANRAGKIAGANAIGAELRAPPVAGTMVFRVFVLEVARSGLISALIHASTRAHAFPGAGKMSVELVADRGSGRLLGGQIVAEEGAVHRIDTVAAALAATMTAEDFAGLDLAYAPPFGPTWDPLLVAATQLVKRVATGSPQ
jgi:NADPH-dependent 2,4-dienoyl-CoA reductase/sulfur reductase-like enzyme